MGALIHVPLEVSKIALDEKYFPSPPGMTLLYCHQQEEDRFSFCLAIAQTRHCHNLANEKLLYLELPVSSSGLFIYNSEPFLLAVALTHSPRLADNFVQCTHVTKW